MSRRWRWDFEDEPRRVRVDPPPAAPLALAPTNAPGPSHRRRRAVAALLLIAALAVLAATLVGPHRGGSPPAARAGARTNGALRYRRPAVPARPDTGADRAIASVLAYTPFVSAGGDRGHDVALTFDDGPGPYTPGVLGVLERLHVRATFFAIGHMERYFSASTTRAIRDGDVIGDHTETHPALALLSAHDQHEELFEQMIRIELLNGPRPRLFRPPYGSFNATTMRELKRLHLLMVLWSVDTGDYQRPGVAEIVRRALAGARPGAIILLHDGGGDRSQTIAALPTIIERLRARGLDPVTVPRLLADDPPPGGLPLPPNLSGD
jgi:peptidoglycan-N-acetylglucosamine deacetylase